MSPAHALACPLPTGSQIAALAQGATCSDAYRMADPQPDASALSTYRAMVTHQPWWMEALMGLRNAVVWPLGLKTGTLQGWRRADPCEQVGDTLGLFTLIEQHDTEVVFTVDDVHLQVWLSLHKHRNPSGNWVTVSSVVKRHPNALGRLYLGVVWPVHQHIVPRLMAHANRHV